MAPRHRNHARHTARSRGVELCGIVQTLMGSVVLWAVLSALVLIAVAQSTTSTRDQCANGQPRDPNQWCGESILGGNTVGNPGGIVAVSTYSSCMALEKENGVQLDCGGSRDASQMTVLDVSITPGSKQIVRFRANLIRAAPNAGQATSAFPGTDGACTRINGQCSVTEEVIVEVETSDSSVVYLLQQTNLEIPYMNVAFHTNAFGTSSASGNKKECSTYTDVGLIEYNEKVEKTDFDEPDNNRRFGKYNTGIVAFNNLITPPINPNFEGVDSFTILSKYYSYYAATLKTTLAPKYNAFSKKINGNPLFVGYMYWATNPGFNPNDNYGMVASTRPGADEILLLPTSPYMTQNPFAIYTGQIHFGIRPFADDFEYEGPGIARTNAEKDAHLKGMWLAMLKKYSGGLTHLSAARVWAGTYFYTGVTQAKTQWFRWTSVDKSLLKKEALNPDDPETRFVSDVRPVCIGCGWGPFFPSNDVLQPVPAKNKGLWQTGDPWPYPGPRRGSNQITCSSDDDDCVGSAASLFTSNRYRQTATSTTTSNAAKPAVPVVKCGPIDYRTIENDQKLFCNEDRIGIWIIDFPPLPYWILSFGTLFADIGITQIFESINGIFSLIGKELGFTNPQYITADTFGTVGEPCQVFQIEPQALPQYAIEVRMFDKSGTLIDRVRLSNIPDQSQSTSNIPNPNEKSEGDKFEGNSGSTLVVGAEHRIFAELTGYDTINGKIAPDLYGNIVICNMTKNQQAIYQSVTDPVFGTPLNPWVYANNDVCDGNTPPNSTNRCDVMDANMCKSGGKVPLPQCLAARPRVEGEEYNPYAWWYYQDPKRASKVNEAFGSSAMPSSRFAEKEIKDQVCRSPRYAGVAGWIPGFDWTLEDRLRDQLNQTQKVYSEATKRYYYGSNAQERALRDKLPAHTACHVVGYFNDWQKEKGCQNFLREAAYQRYLPPNFVVPQGGSSSNLQEQQCSVPQYAVDGTRLLYFGNTQSNTQANVRLRIGISGTLVRVENSVSSGVFDAGDGGANTCSVLRNGRGTAQLLVRNTGTVRGTYLITSSCTNGVRQVGDVQFSLEPSAIAVMQEIPMIQSSSTQLPSPAICTFNLTHPQYRTQIFFDRIDKLPCYLVLVSSSSTSAGQGAWQQDVNLTKVCTPDDNGTVPSFCQPPKIKQATFEANGIAAGLVYYFASVIAVFISVFFCTLNIMSMKLSN